MKQRIKFLIYIPFIFLFSFLIFSCSRKNSQSVENQAEPFLHSFEELDVAAELAEVAPPELDAVLLRLVEHHLHIREDVARVLADSEAVAPPPPACA